MRAHVSVTFSGLCIPPPATLLPVCAPLTHRGRAGKWAPDTIAWVEGIYVNIPICRHLVAAWKEVGS